MLGELVNYVRSHGLGELARDALDVFLVYYLFYRALLVVRGTRAIQVGLGLAAVFTLYLLSQLLQLATVLSILSTLLSSALLIAVVVFQNDIRRGLMRVGSGAWFGASRSQESRVIEEVVEAATILARHRVGAIITFEQDANLDEFVGANKGHEIDAAVTRELLVSLFVPEAMNELHDGAVVIRNLRVAKAGVFFPMPETKVADESFGSRHRAALGITEETDAVVVVVSEERGSISFCFNGNIVSNLDGPGLRAALEGIFSPKRVKKATKGKKKAGARTTQVPAPAPVSQAAEEPHSVQETPVPETPEPSSTGPRTGSEDVPSEPRESEAPAPLRKKAADSEPRKDATTTPLRKSEPNVLPGATASGTSLKRTSKVDVPPARTTEGSRPMPRATQSDGASARRTRAPDEDPADSEPSRNGS